MHLIQVTNDRVLKAARQPMCEMEKLRSQRVYSPYEERNHKEWSLNGLP